MMSLTDRYVEWTLQVARASASIANYCDHVEHNEPTDRAWISEGAATLRRVAVEIAATEGKDLKELYAGRIQQIEQRNPLWSDGDLDGSALVGEANSWRDLQLAQVEHDRRYHPDIVGLSKADQLRHCALHLAKLTGALAEVASGEADHADFVAKRLPDLLLFGLKIATLAGEGLAEDAVPMSHRGLNLVAG